MADAKQEEPVLGLDEGDDDETLKLVSQEQEKFTVPIKVARMSELVKTMADTDKEEKEIPLPNVKGPVLAKVVEYMTYHASNPAQEIDKPLKSANMKEVVNPWDANFVDVDQELLFELILAANYMDIKPLLDLTCATVASMIKGKTPEEIRKTFDIECLANFLRGLSLDHARHGSTRQIQQRLDIHVVGCQNEFEQEDLLNIDKIGVPLLDDLGHHSGFEGLLNFRHGFRSVVLAEFDDLSQDGSFDVGKWNFSHIVVVRVLFKHALH